jgi:predicted DNA-binding transcriptional regulator AlpA
MSKTAAGWPLRALGGAAVRGIETTARNGAARDSGVNMTKKVEIDELPDRMLDTGSVLELTGLSRSELYLAMAERGFPRPYRVHRTRNSFLMSEVMEWIKTQPRPANFKGRTPRKDGNGIQALRRAQWEREQEAGHVQAPE